MHFFILQFLSSFALFMAFAQILTFVQPLLFMRQALLAGRYAAMSVLVGFFITGMIASCIMAFFPSFYLDAIEPYGVFFKLGLLVFCFFYTFICLTGRFTDGKTGILASFLSGAFLALICFVLCASFLVMFSISLGRIGVTSYIFENFGLSIAFVFLILSFIYYYLILLLTLAGVERRLFRAAPYLDFMFAVGFAALGFWLLP